MKAYKYKNIICFKCFGKWHADYDSRFAIHRATLRTKAEAYRLAKQELDYLNRKGEAKCV